MVIMLGQGITSIIYKKDPLKKQKEEYYVLIIIKHSVGKVLIRAGRQYG